MIYIVTEIATGEEVYRYQADAAIEWNGMEFATHTHTEHAEPVEGEVIAPTKRRLTKQDFFDRLGGSAIAFLLTAAKTEVSVEAWIKRLDLVEPDPDGTSVDLDDPRTVQGVTDLGAMMVSLGVVEAGWASGVLNG